jgi:hypothetical protein
MVEIWKWFVLLLLCLVCPEMTSSNGGQSRHFMIPDLGRKFSLGTLYDAKSERVSIGLGLFGMEYPLTPQSLKY